MDFNLGKNRFTTMVDGDEREYYVHVPQTYQNDQSVPVVFMLHGSSGNGLKFYNISGWKEVGETENIITVFPSSWKYCIIDDGKVKNTTKWHAFPGSFEFCNNETPRDDVKFLRQIIKELNQRFNIDNQRIYLVGFSNGGGMAYRAAVEMSDVLAAVVESAGMYLGDTQYTPIRNIPITFQLGNIDRKWFDEGVIVPLSQLDDLLQHSTLFQLMASNHTDAFDYASQYSLEGDTLKVMTATFKGVPDNGSREFRFSLIHGLGHNYPNGKNHPLEGAVLNWEWLKQYSLP
ncbi:MAG TPA: alpha/beta hydrolase [Saprospiraceae bacterium]|nr:alpha/beta hydrolase [Saprospiraceae bacterium]